VKDAGARIDTVNSQLDGNMCSRSNYGINAVLPFQPLKQRLSGPASQTPATKTRLSNPPHAKPSSLNRDALKRQTEEHPINPSQIKIPRSRLIHCPSTCSTAAHNCYRPELACPKSSPSSSVTHTELKRLLFAMTSKASAVSSAWIAASSAIRIFSSARCTSPSLSMKGARSDVQIVGSCTAQYVSLSNGPIMRYRQVKTYIECPDASPWQIW